MSKVVKKVGRAISRVVKGVVKAVKTFAKSKLGKVIMTAAAVYFGGAALLGATGIGSGAAAAAGTAAGGGLAGASAGIQAAWSGLTGAFTGGGLSSATGVFSGGSAAPAPLSVPAVAPPATPVAVPTASNSTIADAMLQSAKISAGTQLVGGLISGIGQQKAADDERKYQEGQAQAARDRYNQNVGTKLWGDAPTVDTGYSGPAQLNSYDPAAEARALAERRRREFEESYPQAGIVSRGMSYQQPTASNGFPIYNPYYYRG